MRIGPLRHRVKIQKPSDTRDGGGRVTRTWPEVAKRWASVEPLTGAEGLQASTTGAQITHRVRMRYLSGVLPEWRIVNDTQTLNIVNILNIRQQNRELVLMCKEDV